MRLAASLVPSFWCRLAVIAAAATVPAVALAQSSAPTEPITYTAWTKVCGQDAQKKTVCLTAKEARGANGAFVGAALIHMQDHPRLILRITLPPGVDRDPRIAIDTHQPVAGKPVGCLPKGCIADFTADTELMSRLKGGRTLAMSGVNASARTITYSLPLAGFARAYEEPPAPPRTLREQAR